MSFPSNLIKALLPFTPHPRARQLVDSVLPELGFGIVSARNFSAHNAAQPIVSAEEDAGPNTNFVDAGGAVLTNVRVHVIFWGRSWDNNPTPFAEDIENAVRTILDSPYMSALTQYRIIGNGTLVGSTRVTNTEPPNPFSDAAVQTLVTGLINGGTISSPAQDAQLLYCVMMPMGVSSENNNVIGEHFNFTFAGAPGQIAWVTNDGTLEFVTTVLSHELVESCTDPQFNAVLGVQGTCTQQGACEIGDVCYSTDIVGGVTVQSYWSQRDRKCVVPKGLVPGAVRGNPVLIQGRFGHRGNFELVTARADFGISHYSRANDLPFVPWSPPSRFGSSLARVDGVSFIQSNFGFPGNLIVVARAEDSLFGFYRDSGPAFNWSDPMTITVSGNELSGISGDPVLIQSRFNGRGNFELVAPLVGGGLSHYSCATNDPNFPWFGPNLFGQDIGRIDAVSMIQSNFGNPGNLEVVVRVGTELLYFWRDSGPAFDWNGPFPIIADGSQIDGVSANPTLIQSRFGGRGNFELIVPLDSGGLAHYFRDNDDQNPTWHGPTVFAQNIGSVDSVSLIQSNFGYPGNLEIVVRFGDELLFFFRDSGPAFHWYGPYQVTPGYGDQDPV
jgi:hypothetical protein